MKVLRTPDSCFADLEGYSLKPNYLQVTNDLQMHYLDEGPKSGPPVVLLHGEPTWSYLYRKMVPPLASAGFRVLAPDLIGFGKSDKPASIRDYSYALHEQWLVTWMDELDLKQEVTLFAQDWGSLLGLRIAGLQPERFSRVMIANGGLPCGDTPMPMAFHLWQAFSAYSPWFPIARIVKIGTVNGLTEGAMAAYDAPFPSNRYKAGARAFPGLVPTSASDPATPSNRRAWEGLGRFDKPFLCVFGRNDPVLGSFDRLLLDHVPGTSGQPHDRIRGGHFIQEDQGEELASRLIAWAR